MGHVDFWQPLYSIIYNINVDSIPCQLISHFAIVADFSIITLFFSYGKKTQNKEGKLMQPPHFCSRTNSVPAGKLPVMWTVICYGTTISLTTNKKNISCSTINKCENKISPKRNQVMTKHSPLIMGFVRGTGSHYRCKFIPIQSISLFRCDD